MEQDNQGKEITVNGNDNVNERNQGIDNIIDEQTAQGQKVKKHEEDFYNQLIIKLIEQYIESSNNDSILINKLTILLKSSSFEKFGFNFIFKKIWEILGKNKENKSIIKKGIELIKHLIQLDNVNFLFSENNNLLIYFFVDDNSEENNIILHFSLIKRENKENKENKEEDIIIKSKDKNIKIKFISNESEKESNYDYYKINENDKIDINLKYLSSENTIELDINEKIIREKIPNNTFSSLEYSEKVNNTVEKKNKGINLTVEFNSKSKYKITHILTIQSKNTFKNNTIKEEINNIILNESNDNKEIKLWNFQSTKNDMIKTYKNIFIELKQIKYEDKLKNFLDFGGINVFLPFFELISGEQEIFEDLSDIILMKVVNNYSIFLDSYKSHFYNAYNFLGKKYYETTKKTNTKLLLILSEIIIREEIILDIINNQINEMKNLNEEEKKKVFYSTHSDKYFNEIFPYIYDLILIAKEDTNALKILSLIVDVFKENHPINDMEEIISKINDVLKNKFSDFETALNELNCNYKKGGFFSKNSIFGYFYTGRNRTRFKFIEEENKKYNLFYTCFNFCEMMFLKEESQDINYKIIKYIILNLKIGYQAEDKINSLFYHNVNFLILLLNHIEENNFISLRFIFNIIKQITPDSKIKEENDYFNLDLRFNNQNNDTSVQKDMDKFIKYINSYKYKKKNNYLLDCYNLKIYRDIKKELFSWNSSLSNLDLYYTDIEVIKEKYNNNEQLENKIKFKRCFHLTKDMTIPLLEPILDYKYYKSNFSQSKKGKNEFNVFRTNYETIIDLNLKIKPKELNDKFIPKELENDYRKKRIIKCCVCKINYHITGYLILYDSYCEFFANTKVFQNKGNKYKCYGSLGEFDEETKDNNYYLKIIYEHIFFFLKRKYYFEDIALEFYYDNNKTYFLIFENENERNRLFNLITINFETMKLNPDEKIIEGKFHNSYLKLKKGKKEEKNKKEDFTIFNIYNLWKKSEISTLEYLMWINIFGRRSYRDLTQYPVFPWIISNYLQDKRLIDKLDFNIQEKEDLILDNLFNKYLRPLNSPMGMIEINEKSRRRKECYIETYTDLMREILTDKTEKTSLEKSKNIIKTLKIEENEEINIDHLLKKEPIINEDLNKEFKRIIFPNDKIKINDLYNKKEFKIESIPYFYGSHYSNPAYISYYLSRILPFSFSAIEIQGNSFGVADRLFMNLERSFISSSSEKSDLRELIPEFFFLPNLFWNFNNLNFGFLQDKSSNQNSTSKILRAIREKKKIINENDKIYVNEVLTGFWNKNNSNFFVFLHRKILENKKLKINDWIKLIFGILSVGDEARKNQNLFMPYCYDNVISLRINDIEEDMKLSYIKLFELGVNAKQVFYSDVNDKRDNSLSRKYEKKSFVNQENEKIEKFFYINEKDNLKTFKGIKHLEKFNSNISAWSIYITSTNKIYYILGLDNGIILVYKKKENDEYDLVKIINNHSKKIKYININDNLNMFIECSEDNYINLYTLPNLKLIHSMKIPNTEFVLLTSSPLIGFIVITNKEIFMFTINGDLVYYINNNIKFKEPTIINDDEFNDYLYDTKTKELIKIPLLQRFKIIN